MSLHDESSSILLAEFRVRYFAAYVAFFLKSIETNGVGATLDEYIFSKKYNFVEGLGVSSQPAMLVRFLAGVIHPLIHTGYGAEFGIPGIVAEGERYDNPRYMYISWKIERSRIGKRA